MKYLPRLRSNLQQGFTLTELLVATLIGGIVIAVAGNGMVNILFKERDAISEQQRRTELNRTIDFISEDVRMARRVNAVNDTTTLTAANSVTQSATTLGAFNPGLGSIGTPILYLEIPLGFADCDANGTLDNPQNVSGGGPSEYIDRVVYDIRSPVSTTTWLGPRIIGRYGRIPNTNNPQVPVDPCSQPQASITVVDGIAASGVNLGTCNGVTSGTGGGFLACVDSLTQVGVTRVTLALGGIVNKVFGTTEIYEFNSGVYNRAQEGLTSADVQSFINANQSGATIATCTVPNIVGQLRTAANTTITGAGLAVGVSTGSGTGTANQVWQQNPAAGTTTPCGTAVNYNFYPQVIATCRVPSVIGMAPNPAGNTLINDGFTFNEQVISAAPQDVDLNQVLSQSPQAGADVLCGSLVTFTYKN